MQKTSVVSQRIEALDYLRGFFILVIIVDHLWRWPNLFQFLSGRGELWVSAAEGFVMISGLLVGYVRGRKGMKKPFGEIAKKLVARGVMLYIWAFITTVVIVAASWYLKFRADIAFIPYPSSDWLDVIRDALTLQYTHSLSHFLYLYAIFLVLSPLLVWLLRQGIWWVGAAVSVCLWTLGFLFSVEWLQWQLLFFVPAIAGFYLDHIIAYCRRLPWQLVWLFVGAAVVTMVWSFMTVLPNPPGSYHIELFGREPLAPARIILAFVWFISLAWIFNRAIKWLEPSVGWLLMPFGTRSLTSYIVHGLPLMLIAFFVPATNDSFWINTLLAAAAVIGTWAIVSIPGINRVVPR
jgi:hypothetical protein